MTDERSSSLCLRRGSNPQPCDDRWDALTIDLILLTNGNFCLGGTYVELAPALAIWVSVVQWLQRLTGHHKVAGSIPVWDSEIGFLRLGLHEHSSFFALPSLIPLGVAWLTEFSSSTMSNLLSSTSFHLNFGLPLGLFPCTSSVRALFIAAFLSFLSMCPNHRNLVHRSFKYYCFNACLVWLRTRITRTRTKTVTRWATDVL